MKLTKRQERFLLRIPSDGTIDEARFSASDCRTAEGLLDVGLVEAVRLFTTYRWRLTEAGRAALAAAEKESGDGSPPA